MCSESVLQYPLWDRGHIQQLINNQIVACSKSLKERAARLQTATVSHVIGHRRRRGTAGYFLNADFLSSILFFESLCCTYISQSSSACSCRVAVTGFGKSVLFEDERGGLKEWNR